MKASQQVGKLAEKGATEVCVAGSEKRKADVRTRHFRDLLVWQRSMQLARDVYAATNSLPKAELFGLTSQVRRAAVSVPSNIAEGQGRLTDKSFRVFLSQARGSLLELETQLELAGDLGYLDRPTINSLAIQTSELSRMLNGLIRAMKDERE